VSAPWPAPVLQPRPEVASKRRVALAVTCSEG
jgi:hypothetical protein